MCYQNAATSPFSRVCSHSTTSARELYTMFCVTNVLKCTQDRLAKVLSGQHSLWKGDVAAPALRITAYLVNRPFGGPIQVRGD